MRYAPNGSIAVASPARPKAQFEGRTYVLERALPADFAIVHAWKGDHHGNLVFRKAARNFNPVCAMAGKIAIAEVEHLVEPGEIHPDAVHLASIYIDQVVVLTPQQAAAKGSVGTPPTSATRGRSGRHGAGRGAWRSLAGVSGEPRAFASAGHRCRTRYIEEGS